MSIINTVVALDFKCCMKTPWPRKEDGESCIPCLPGCIFFFFLQIILSNVESVDQCRRIKTQVIQDAFTPFLSYFKHSCVPIYSMGELGMVSSIKQETSKYLFNK